MKLRTERGFTLLELMMSLVILSIALMGILPLFFYSQAQLKEATLSNLGISIIQSKMERILNLNYDLINYTDFDNAYFPGRPEYTYILPERATSPCITYVPNPCGYVSNNTSPYYNKLLDIVEVDRYYFTRVIDVDDPDDFNSLEPDDYGPGGSNLPADMMTKRVTLTVYWTVPGGKQHFVSSTTQIFDAPDWLE
ncbi:type II secretion system protein [bacterium]|nr:type II secretion system protein [candidate division CSSED10-310 bacterium]